ncbi:MAG TPA: response regulator [Polyangiaceae bacterium]
MPNDSKPVVLIADDEPSTVAMLSSHLRSKGYAVLEASDGDQAWELAHEHLPHLVLLDVMMPGMSGWEVCRKIREAVSLAHTGVIMLTGIGENLNEMTSPLYGADAHLDKPFDFSDLDREIEGTLSRRRAGMLGRADAEEDPAGLVRKTLRAVTSVTPKAKAKPAPVLKLRDSDVAKPSLAKTVVRPAKAEPTKTKPRATGPAKSAAKKKTKPVASSGKKKRPASKPSGSAKSTKKAAKKSVAKKTTAKKGAPTKGPAKKRAPKRSAKKSKPAKKPAPKRLAKKSKPAKKSKR